MSDELVQQIENTIQAINGQVGMNHDNGDKRKLVIQKLVLLLVADVAKECALDPKRGEEIQFVIAGVLA